MFHFEAHIALVCRLSMKDLTVLGLKKLIHEQRPDLPPYKQKLICRSSGPRPLEDDRRLTSFPGLQDKSVINLIVQIPWEIYLQAGDGKLHTVEIPSSTPNVSPKINSSTHICIKGVFSVAVYTIDLLFLILVIEYICTDAHFNRYVSVYTGLSSY